MVSMTFAATASTSSVLYGAKEVLAVTWQPSTFLLLLLLLLGGGIKWGGGGGGIKNYGPFYRCCLLRRNQKLPSSTVIHPFPYTL